MSELFLMRPEWLWALLPALLLALWLWRQTQKRGSWQSVIAPELLQHLVGEKAGEKRSHFVPLILLGWILAAFAASGPSWHKIPQPIHQKQDGMVLILDLSYSMKSQDLPPSRLDRARQKLLDLLELRREGQTGLIAYAGDAHIVTPLTDDTPTIANLLPALYPDMMPVPGSDAASAVAMALELLHSAGMRQGKILLVTDAVSADHAKTISKLVSGSGAVLTVMGVGTANGAPIPLPRGGFLKDDRGTIVVPALNTKALQRLASNSGGHFTRMQIDDSDLTALLADNPLDRAEQTLALDRTADTWEDQGYIFVLLLLPLALGLFRRGWILCLLPVLLVFPSPQSEAQVWDDLWLTPDQQGQRALQEGNNDSAAQLFENPNWAGTAAFRAGDYPAAAEHFGTASDADGWYNQGNALARAGQLEEAAQAYEESIALDPSQQDAAENLELVTKLQEQQEQQQNQEQENQDQNQQQDEKEGEDSNENGEQSDQEQESGQNGEPKDPSNSSNENQQHEGASDQEQSPEESEQTNSDDPNSDENSESQAQQPPGDPQESEPPSEPGAIPETDQERERNQAMEQWLRRVPDDPSGLLREKFRYESRLRQEQGNQSDEETTW
jgi:Ca-activated chloride channel family protein